MIDIKRIKENPDAIKAGMKAKEVDCDATIDRILELDVQVRGLKTHTETKTAEKNKLAKENGKLFGQKKGAEKKGEDTSALEAQINANMAASVKIDEEIAEDKQKLKELDAARRTTSPCATSARSIPLILSPSTMWTCARTWASSTTSGASSWPVPATGSIRAWALAWSGLC